MNLSAAEILSAQDLKFTDEQVPEWPKEGEPGVIRLCQLDAAETIEMTNQMNKAPRDGMFIILVYTACDTDSTRLFPLEGTDEEKTQLLEKYVSALKRKSFIVLSRLQNAALKVNSMGPRAKAEAKND